MLRIQVVLNSYSQIVDEMRHALDFLVFNNSVKYLVLTTM